MTDQQLSNEQRYFELLMTFAAETADADTLDRIERLLNVSLAVNISPMVDKTNIGWTDAGRE